MINPFKVDYSFIEDEILLAFKYKMLRIMIVLMVFFSLSFAMMHILGVHQLGSIEYVMRYLHAFIGVVSLLVLNRYKSSYIYVSYGIILISVLFFVISLIDEPHDTFREIWFVATTIAAFIVGGKRLGLITFILSVISIFIAYFSYDLEINQTTLQTIIISFAIITVILYLYVSKIDEFEKNLLSSHNRFEHLASHDTLTGLMNRRVFLEVANKYLFETHRSDEKFYFLMIDIDNFKSVNDMYGHKVGDNVLIHCANLIKNSLRENDLFGRLGGEEFGVVVMEKSVMGALSAAEKLRNIMEENLYPMEGHMLNVTISIGVSNDKDKASLDELMHDADSAMYVAKRTGRNKVCLSEAD